MGKKNKPDLGKSIIKHRAKTGGNIKHANSWLHCSELDDDAGPNLSSITEQSALDDFLATAELAGTEFAAEKLNTTIVTPRHNEGLLNSETTDAIKQAQKENQHFLRIPRRPEWDQNMTTEELDQKERDTFLQWRRQLAELQEKEHILLTPFERNLDFWRQLWRVIERSDVVVQIVDARNPLLYRCEDLENYVTEVDPKKCNLLLINKADFLTSDQRDMWARYFRSVGLRVAFWSAQLENERLTAMNTSDDSDQEEKKEENEAEENSDESDVKVLPRFSEMSFEENTAPEEQLESLDPTSAMETKTTSSGLQPSEEEEQRVSPSNSRSRDSERLNEDVIVLSEGFSCIPEDDMTCDATSLLTNDKKPVPEQELIVQSDAAQTQEQCTNYDRLGDERTISETSSDGDGEKAKHCPGKAFESNRAQVPEDQHLCNTDDMDSDFPGKILTKDELLALFKMIHLGREQRSTAETETMLTTVGLVGYPNVGKSSTINTLLNDKKVPVSATPGRTKHFQTLYVNDEVLLCDCPGLVFPSFVSTKADMILNGILPIDQMRDHVAPVSLVCQRIPCDALETAYGINIPPPEEGEDPNRAPYADELLNAYGYIRGFMTSHGIPDCSRSSRYVLKDYVKGKLLFCIAPPGENDEDFQQIGCNVQEYADVEGKVKKVQGTGPKQMSNVDKDFFKQEQVRCFSRGIHVTGRPFAAASTAQAAGEQGAVPLKPWKKHYNRNKREKLRRLAKK